MLTKGDTLAGYRVEDVLGHGGMGVVYRATQLSLDRTVALKVVAAHLGSDPTFRDRFRREGRIQATLEHPNIITIYEAGESEEGLFIAMRLVDGPNLKELLLSGDLPPTRSMKILRQVAEALDVAHESGLVHRDIKPQNILVGPRDHAYLADFGLTKPPGQRSLTQSGQFLGSLDYISPEQIKGQQADSRSDIYSFGAVTYECLTGIVPYPRDTEAAVLYAHLADPPPSPTEANPTLPASLDAPIDRALSKDPADRPSTAGDFVEEIDHAAGGKLPETAPRPVIVLPPPEPTPSRAPMEHAPLANETILDKRVVSEPRTPIARPTKSGAKPRRVAITAGVVAVALTAAGFAVGKSASPNGSSTASTLKAKNLSLSVPASWRRAVAPHQKYGMTLESPILVTNAAGGGAATLLAGWVMSTDATLIPSTQAIYGLTINATHPKTTGIAGGTAVAYLGRDRNLIAFFLPTTGKTLVVVCENPLAASGSLRQCESIASTIRLSAVKSVPLQPDAAYGQRVQGALLALASSKTRALLAMTGAKKATSQAVAARDIATAYTKAASTLAPLSRGADPRLGAANGRLVDALRTSASAYSALATAADKSNAAAYSGAAKRASVAESNTSSALNALRALGYRVARA
jgi:serine/threonine protein kinase